MEANSSSLAGTPEVETIPSTPIAVVRTVAAWRKLRASLLRTSYAGTSLQEEASSSRSEATSAGTPPEPTIALVPTMGALHEGHVSLMRAAAARDTHVVVSVYVNPTQFGANEDLGSYPRTWDRDAKVLAELDAELAARPDIYKGRIAAVFLPSDREMYPTTPPGQLPDSPGTYVLVQPLSRLWEGVDRPTFFRGVATVCTKLFCAVGPHRAYFGQKDVQQTVVVRSVVRDLLLPLEIVVEPTRREPEDGLAMSSRNAYLGNRRRRRAGALFLALQAAVRVLQEMGHGARVEDMEAAGRRILVEQQVRDPTGKTAVTWRESYFAVVDRHTMQPLERVDLKEGCVIIGAIVMDAVSAAEEGEDVGDNGGKPVRLIDNLVIDANLDEAGSDRPRSFVVLGGLEGREVVHVR